MASTWDDASSVLQDEEEQNVIMKTLDSFYSYRHQMHHNITHRRRLNFAALPAEHRQLFSAAPFLIPTRLNAVDTAIDANAEIAEGIFWHSVRNWGLDEHNFAPGSEPWRNTCEESDLAKANTIINQFYRDWSAEGASERIAHFGPVLDDLDKEFGELADRSSIKVLVPGAGLGRLVHEICYAGFHVEGNEISYHALSASDWIINSLEPGQQFPLYPFASRFSNQETFVDQMQMVLIPDVHPATALSPDSNSENNTPPGTMEMSASDFLTAYRRPEQKDNFDAVATVFFIDTAPNLMRYIETISHTLKSGGLWINVGPLLWHFEDRAPSAQNKERTLRNGTPDWSSHGGINGDGEVNGYQEIVGIEEPGSIELTREDVANLVRLSGFEFILEECKEENVAGYIQQPTTMLRSVYRVFHFVARKL